MTQNGVISTFFLTKDLVNSENSGNFATEFPVVPDESQTIGCRFLYT